MIWCLHGNIGMTSDWDILSELPSMQEQTIRKVDLWRYLACRSIGLQEFGEVFASEVVAQDPEPYLVGYSMGGRLALHSLIAQPKLWKGATIISAHPGLSTEEERVARRKKDAEWSALALKGDWAEFLNTWNAQTLLGDFPSTLADRYLLQPRSQEIARAFCAWSLGAQEDLRGKLSEVSIPIELVTGDQDEKYMKLAEEMNFSNVDRIIIPNAGHRPLWENPTAKAWGRAFRWSV